MAVRSRKAVLAAVASLALGIGVGVGAQAQQGSQPPAPPPQPRVTIIDNNGTFQPGDPLTGLWGFAPAHLTVRKGQTIVVDNPQGNFRPHTVTSITTTGQFAERKLEHGTLFDSSPTREALVMPGGSFTLDTTDWNPGHYLYYCSIHPWMVGTITVTPAN